TEIHLLTDLQATSVGARTPAQDGGPPVVVWHPGTDAPVNRAVADVEVGGGLAPVAGQRTTVAATISGTAVDDDAPVDVRLAIDGRLVAAAAARVGATALLSLPARAPGIVTGSVEVDADALHADDRRYFAARILPPPRVLLAGAQPFVADALEVLTE